MDNYPDIQREQLEKDFTKEIDPDEESDAAKQMREGGYDPGKYKKKEEVTDKK